MLDKNRAVAATIYYCRCNRIGIFRKQKLSERLTDADRFDGRTCIITGANSGLGFALAVDKAVKPVVYMGISPDFERKTAS